ncbi:unnamed protein product [Pedinophyceae sp. YPF-701]|nr:unnamed protein product [Pedinophyceae sp. YPF-701]
MPAVVLGRAICASLAICRVLHLATVQSVTLHTTLGDLKLELYCEECPRTAENFLALCASGYYNNVIFHRNIKGFMVQGGDPTGTGKGGRSIYASETGKFADEIVESLKHNRRGTLSMANSGPNSNGSQFFIAYKAHNHLNGKYTLFGQLIDGMGTLDKMERVPVGANDRPLQEIRINRVTVHANPIADQA